MGKFGVLGISIPSKKTPETIIKPISEIYPLEIISTDATNHIESVWKS